VQTWWGCTLVTRSTSSFWSDTCSWALTNCIAHLRRRALICKACFTSQRQPTHLRRSMHNKTWAPGSSYSCSTECEWQGKEQTTIKLSLLPHPFITTYHSRAYASCGQHEHACKHTLDRLALNKLQLSSKTVCDSTGKDCKIVTSCKACSICWYRGTCSEAIGISNCWACCRVSATASATLICTNRDLMCT